MQVFEFHFNPRQKSGGKNLPYHWSPDLAFNSYCSEPGNIYEKRLGSLYMVGLLKSVLPQNVHFLDKVAETIKKRFYRNTLSAPEKSLKASLKEANEFFEQTAKKGDVSWLGNFNFAVLTLRNYKLNFTKTGNIKIFLVRNGKILDIDKKLNLEDIEPYPLKIFGSVISGKLMEGDLLLILTEEVEKFFREEKILQDIADFTQFSNRNLHQIFDEKGEKLNTISGVCLAVLLTKDAYSDKKETISLKQPKQAFSLKETFSPVLKFLAFNHSKKKIKKEMPPSAEKKSEKKPDKGGYKLKLPNLHFSFPGLDVFLAAREKFDDFRNSLVFDRKLIFTFLFFIILALGAFFSAGEKKDKISDYQVRLDKIQENINLADSYAILNDANLQNRAGKILKDCWSDITSIARETQDFPASFYSRVISLKNDISQRLEGFNKVSDLKNPAPYFSFSAENYIPHRLVVNGQNIYFFSPYGSNIAVLSPEKRLEVIEEEMKIDLAQNLEEGIVLFSKPDKVMTYNDGKLFSSVLEKPYEGFSFDDLAVFGDNLYFLDIKAGQIIRYVNLGDFDWGRNAFWLKKSAVGKSLAVDGSVWILENGNIISEYYNGSLRNKIELEIFPEMKDASRIYTSASLPYLFVEDPLQKRIVLLSKEGQLIKQIRSDKFDNILDFGVNPDAKTLWILNGMDLYKAEI